MARPYLNAHLLILSAHLSQRFAGHRLGQDSIASPLEDLIVRHSGTRFLNVRNPIGAEINFRRARKRVLDAFAVVLLGNIVAGATTVLVSRKALKKECADYLGKRLLEWGVRVRFITGSQQHLPAKPDPLIVPVIHYGLIGVNDYEDYDTCLCLNSYYIDPRVLDGQVMEGEPGEAGNELRIESGKERLRRAVSADPIAADPGLVDLGNMYLRKMEVDPVLQAVGRVRFLTRPRSVITFALHDFAKEVGEVEECQNLGSMLRALGLPSPAEVDRHIQAIRIRSLMDAGLTAHEAADAVGISRRSVFIRLRQLESADRDVLVFLYASFCTPPTDRKSLGAKR